LIEQQLHDIEEQNKLSKDDVKSQSSNDSQNSQIEHLEEQLAQMNEAMEKLTKENETL
jgi:polyhydroxyalkanoate synthesis regulator phasin